MTEFLILVFFRVLSRGTVLLSLWTSPQNLQPGAAGKVKNLTERIILQVLHLFSHLLSLFHSLHPCLL